MGKALKGGTLSISWGESVGFYVHRSSAAKRLCLWRVALTYLPYDLDEVLAMATGALSFREAARRISDYRQR